MMHQLLLARQISAKRVGSGGTTCHPVAAPYRILRVSWREPVAGRCRRAPCRWQLPSCGCARGSPFQSRPACCIGTQRRAAAPLTPASAAFGREGPAEALGCCKPLSERVCRRSSTELACWPRPRRALLVKNSQFEPRADAAREPSASALQLLHTLQVRLSQSSSYVATPWSQPCFGPVLFVCAPDLLDLIRKDALAGPQLGPSWGS
jgi:hypothetical protein